MPDASPSLTAERQRLLRERRRRGVFVVPVEVTCEMIQALVDQGHVDEANSSDLNCVGKAITAAARRGLDLTSGECLLLGVLSTDRRNTLSYTARWSVLLWVQDIVEVSRRQL